MDMGGTECQAKGLGLGPVDISDWESGAGVTGIFEQHVFL